jgi:uncharacterized iron-regulated membrane protein
VTWARIHRWLAIVLVVLLVVWSVTGLLFHLKPGWARAYDQLSCERRDAPLHVQELANVATLGTDVERLELFDTVIGPLYRASTKTGPRLFDARTARALPALDVEQAKTLAVDAVSRSTHRAEYGEPVAATADADTVHVRFAEGPVVDVDRLDARISQQGADTARIDWLYRVHYLQWTGHPTLDKALALLGLALIWAVMIPGIVLFVRRFRSRS